MSPWQNDSRRKYKQIVKFKKTFNFIRHFQNLQRQLVHLPFTRKGKVGAKHSPLSWESWFQRCIRQSITCIWWSHGVFRDRNWLMHDIFWHWLSDPQGSERKCNRNTKCTLDLNVALVELFFSTWRIFAPELYLRTFTMETAPWNLLLGIFSMGF